MRPMRLLLLMLLLVACGRGSLSPDAIDVGGEDGMTGVDAEVAQGLCANGAQDPGEEGVDCGGDCAPCQTGDCEQDEDCDDGRCEDGACVEVPPCENGEQDNGEGDVDCGGACAPCAIGRACVGNADCENRCCHDGVCTEHGTCVFCGGSPPEEICDGVDNDCDGDTDERALCEACAWPPVATQVWAPQAEAWTVSEQFMVLHDGGRVFMAAARLRADAQTHEALVFSVDEGFISVIDEAALSAPTLAVAEEGLVAATMTRPETTPLLAVHTSVDGQDWQVQGDISTVKDVAHRAFPVGVGGVGVITVFHPISNGAAHVRIGSFDGGDWDYHYVDGREPDPAARVLVTAMGDGHVLFRQDTTGGALMHYESGKIPKKLDGEGGRPAATIGSDGGLVVLYESGADQIRSVRFQGATWTEPQQVGSGHAPALATSPDGEVFAAWIDVDGEVSLHLDEGGVWTPLVVVEGLVASGRDVRSLNLAAVGANVLHLGVVTLGDGGDDPDILHAAICPPAE